MTLFAIVPGKVWHAQQPLRFGPLRLTTRMTVVRLDSGALWIHSPVAPTENIRRELHEMGPVRFVVAPNKSHHLFFREFLDAYPDAQGWVADGLKAKRADLADFPELGGTSPWENELASYFIQGLPIINETAWFHHSTRTLILTDLLFSFGKNNPWLTRFVAGALGVMDGLGMSRTMKLAVKDRAAFAESVRPLLALPVERVIVAHDQIITNGARPALQRAFGWVE